MTTGSTVERASPPARDPHPPAAPPGGRAAAAAVGLAALVAVAVPLNTALGASGPFRVGCALIFLVLVPGVPLIALLRVPDRLVAAGLAVALSLAAHILVTVGQLVAGGWAPPVADVGMAAVALAAAPAALRRTRPWARPQPVPADDTRPLPVQSLRDRLPAAAVLTAALALFAIQIHDLDLGAAGVLGVLDVVGWPYAAALALIAGVLAHQLLRSRLDPVVLSAAVLALVVVLFGLTNLADTAAGVPSAWLHVGYVRYIAEHGAIATGFDARFSWPGFFALFAQVAASAGLPDASPFLLLSPIMVNAAAMPFLYVIGRALTGSARLAWLGVLIAVCANWYQQDYFSPQAMVMLLHLAVLATMTWMVAAAPGSAPEPAGSRWRRVLAAVRRVPALPPGLTPGTAAAVEVVLVVLVAAVVVSHQLTPVALVLALSWFAATGCTRFRSLWLVAVLLVAAWFSYGATDFWSGHLDQIFGDIGRLANLRLSLGGRISGDPVYVRGQLGRVAWSGLLLLVGLLGLAMRRARPRSWLVGGLALTPFVLVGLQSYGGEVLIRSFLYATPFLAPLAALAIGGALRPGARPWRWAAVAVVIAAAASVQTYARGLNTAFERMPPSLFAASTFALDQLPDGGTIGVLITLGSPPQNARVTEIRVVPVLPGECRAPMPACLSRFRPDLLLITGTQERKGQLQNAEAPGWSARIADGLVAGRGWARIYQRDDTQVLRRVPGVG